MSTPISADDLHHFLQTRRTVRRFKPDPVADEVVARVLATAAHAPSAHNLQPWRFIIVGRNGIPPKGGRIANPPHDGEQRVANPPHDGEQRIANPPHDGEQRVANPLHDGLAHALTSALRADMTRAGASESEIESRVTRSVRRIREAPVIVLLCRDAAAVREPTREEEIMSIQSTAAAATYLLLAAHAEGLGGNWICWPLYAQEESRQALDLPEIWEPQAMIFLGYADEEPKEKSLKSPNDIVKYV